MKSLLVLLLLAIASTAHAQKAGGILVVADNSDVQRWTRIVNAIKLQYDGVVSVRGDLPSELDFDAIMMFRPWSPTPGGMWMETVVVL